MVGVRRYSLESIRTDGWFERIGETIGSFQALCDILGPRFFAFAMITGARITSLTVDRRTPDNTTVEFTIGEETDDSEAQAVTLADFRRRLVGALVQEEPLGARPERDTDTEGIQLHVGVRYLLLAPIFGYTLQAILLESEATQVELLNDGVEEIHDLTTFRARLRTLVRQELERVNRSEGEGAIDLSRVVDAQRAAAAGKHEKVLELLGAWPAPLAIFLRTPEGQMLGDEARATVAQGLGLLGSACAELKDFEKSEEILRLAVQYAGDGVGSADSYCRLGQTLLAAERPGEAIGPLRRALNLKGDKHSIYPALAQSFYERKRKLAAFAVLRQAQEIGLQSEILSKLELELKRDFGPALDNYLARISQL